MRKKQVVQSGGSIRPNGTMIRPNGGTFRLSRRFEHVSLMFQIHSPELLLGSPKSSYIRPNGIWIRSNLSSPWPNRIFEALDGFRTLWGPWVGLGKHVMAPIRASNLRSKCLSLVRNVKYLEISENTWNYLKTPWRQEQGKIMRKVCKKHSKTRDSTLQWGDKYALKTSTSFLHIFIYIKLK